MGYVGVRGGERAIVEAARALEFLRTRSGGESFPIHEIAHQFHALHSRVLSEGGLYDPSLVALALKQCCGDPLEAASLVRAYRLTKPRLPTSPVQDTGRMRLIRRISAAFKNIPGGQILGPTTDYNTRLFRLDLWNEPHTALSDFRDEYLRDLDAGGVPLSFPKVLDHLRQTGLLLPLTHNDPEPVDITREPIVFPCPRSAALMQMTRGETGSLLALAYSNMRGYGDIHPTVAELRVGYLPIFLPHPVSGEPMEAGEVLFTECELIAMFQKGDAQQAGAAFTLGYGACFGHNEVKAIAMAVLDRALQKPAGAGPRHPSEDAEFVLLHVDGLESSGFASHYKMPHYVTFESDMDRLRAAQAAGKLCGVTNHAGGK